jgi:hypothetical protein
MNSCKDIVVSCFDYTGNMVFPWSEAGYICYCIDLRHNGEMKKGNITFLGADMRTWKPDFDISKVVFQAYFPPCTHVATSGSRWFREKGIDKLIDALELFNIAIKMAETIKAPYIIENPVSTISSYWRKPDYVFNPCDYAGYLGGEDDLYTKKTCLWTGGCFRMPEPRRLSPVYGSMMHLVSPSSDRGNFRSQTPKGFAYAVFEANAPHLRQ